MMLLCRGVGVWVGLALLLALPVRAGVVVGSTRVVFPGDDKEVTLRLSNQGERPSLVEAWVDDGDLHSTPDNAHAPFLVTPPLFRMDAGKEQSLRIFTMPHVFAADRESLFWLNVLEIPPKPRAAEQGVNFLQFAVRSRLKLFYRPAGLHGEPAAAPARLRWSRAGGGDPAGSSMLELANPTPYFITLIKLVALAGGRTYTGDTDMVAPFGHLRLALGGLSSWPAGVVRIEFETVNDYGAAVSGKAEIGP